MAILAVISYSGGFLVKKNNNLRAAAGAFTLDTQTEWETGTYDSNRLQIISGIASLKFDEYQLDLTGCVATPTNIDGDIADIFDGDIDTGVHFNETSELVISCADSHSISKIRMYIHDEVQLLIPSQGGGIGNCPGTSCWEEKNYSPVVETDYFYLKHDALMAIPDSYLYEFEAYELSQSATHTSAATQIDGTTTLESWDTFTATEVDHNQGSGNAATTIEYQFRSGDGTAGDGGWSAWTAKQDYSGSALDLSALSADASHRYLQVLSTLTTTDVSYTPTLSDYTVNYTRDDTCDNFDRVELNLASASIEVGETLNLTALAIDSGGNSMAAPTITWSKSGGTLTSLTGGSSTFSAASSGTYTVSITSDCGGSDSITISVSEPAEPTPVVCSGGYSPDKNGYCDYLSYFLRVVSPNGGEVYILGQTMPISFKVDALLIPTNTAKLAEASIDVYLSRDSGANFVRIIYDLDYTQNSSYVAAEGLDAASLLVNTSYLIPNDAGLPTENARILVRIRGTGVTSSEHFMPSENNLISPFATYDYSDNDFAIRAVGSGTPTPTPTPTPDPEPTPVCTPSLPNFQNCDGLITAAVLMPNSGANYGLEETIPLSFQFNSVFVDLLAEGKVESSKLDDLLVDLYYSSNGRDFSRFSTDFDYATKGKLIAAAESGDGKNYLQFNSEFIVPNDQALFDKELTFMIRVHTNKNDSPTIIVLDGQSTNDQRSTINEQLTTADRLIFASLPVSERYQGAAASVPVTIVNNSLFCLNPPCPPNTYEPLDWLLTVLEPKSGDIWYLNSDETVRWHLSLSRFAEFINQELGLSEEDAGRPDTLANLLSESNLKILENYTYSITLSTNNGEDKYPINLAGNLPFLEYFGNNPEAGGEFYEVAVGGDPALVTREARVKLSLKDRRTNRLVASANSEIFEIRGRSLVSGIRNLFENNLEFLSRLFAIILSLLGGALLVFPRLINALAFSSINELISNLFIRVANFFGLLLFGLKKRRLSGIVYDSSNFDPVPNAQVLLFRLPSEDTGESGKLTTVAVSGEDGRFKMPLEPGRYQIQIKKSGFVFPSKYIRERDYQPLPNNYFGEVFEIQDYSSERDLNYNFPVDLEDPEYLQERVRTTYRLTLAERILTFLNYPLLIIGTLISALAVYSNLNLLNIGILILYLPLWMLGINQEIRLSSWGKVIDQEAKSPLSLALVRAYAGSLSPEGLPNGRLKRTVATNEEGRFYLRLDPGNYQLTASKSDYENYKPRRVKIFRGMDYLSLILQLMPKMIRMKKTTFIQEGTPISNQTSNQPNNHIRLN